MKTDLVILAQHGDKGAFALIAAEIADRFLAVSRRILRDLDLAEDATQQALFAIWRGGQTAAVPGATTMQFWVLDVHGTRLVMFTEAYNATPAEIAESVGVLESVRFQ